MIRLQDLTLQAYSRLKASGMLYEFYPEATGKPDDDLQAVVVRTGMINTVDNPKYIKHYFYDILDEEAEYDFQ